MASSSAHPLSRRTFLSVGAAGLALSALPACQFPAAPDLTDPTSPASTSDADWAAIRAQFMIAPGVIFMNNASIGMPPTAVVRAVSEGYETLSQNPIHAKHDLQALIQERLRPQLAQFVGANADEVVFTRNASEALHLGALGLRLNPGDEVVITTQEHPAGRRPWMYRQAHHGVHVKEVFIPSPLESETDVLARISAALSNRTRAMAFCHVTRGGHRYPVKALTALARDRGLISIVDGAQAIGMFPIDLEDLGCDVYAASLHKWLLGPIGTGLLYIRTSARPQFASTFAPTSTPDQPQYDPIGTMDLPLKAGLMAALDFVENVGIEAIGVRNRYLSDYLKTELAKVPHVRLLSGVVAPISAPGSTIFERDGVDPDEAVAALAEHNIHIDEHRRDGHAALRISTHFYNTTEEIHRMMEALTAFIG